ncbi:MAG: Zn-ribbon domain-containing OB-fold protein [Pyrobaculum sp.]|uniref:Zn-ribbon domain-containing OB-fold protein n=1 Tax=Pyrobaculum sp. TaxID=2004705 RepID=UPI003165339F
MTSELFAALKTGRLIGSRCKNCGRTHFPPARRCARCGGEVQLEEIPKRGVVLTFSEVYVSSPAFTPPYVVAIAQFGDFKVPGMAVDKVEIGDEVEWEVADRHGNLWYFFRTVKHY